MKNIDNFLNLVREIYHDEPNVLLHRPYFTENAKTHICECIDSNFVSSVGQRVIDFENKIAEICQSNYAIATVNGTSALHIALKLCGVDSGTEVITQAVSFIATCNAIKYCNADPVFVDVSRCTLGMDPESLRNFLENHARKFKNGTYNNQSGNRISACVPMHTFGHPCEIKKINDICKEWNIPIVEDAAESLGSFYEGKHTGTFGKLGIFSFNGNKIVTTGGGGMIVTDDPELAKKAKHLTTTAKIPHPYEYCHDYIGYNYRLPNLNAALGCEQLDNLETFLSIKRELAEIYASFFNSTPYNFVQEPQDCRSNYWLNAIILESKRDRDEFLKKTNENNVMTRPIWCLLNKQKMYKHAISVALENSKWLEDRVVNIPSSVPNPAMKGK